MQPPRDTLEWFMGSRLRAGMVRHLVAAPGDQVWLRELYRGFKSFSSASDSVRRLEHTGVLKRRRTASSWYFEIQRDHALYVSLRALVAACDEVDDRAKRPRPSCPLGSADPPGAPCQRGRARRS